MKTDSGTTLSNISLAERAYRIRRNAVRMGQCKGRDISHRHSESPTCWRSPTSMRCATGRRIRLGGARPLLPVDRALCHCALRRTDRGGRHSGRRARDVRHRRQPAADVGDGVLHARDGDHRRLAGARPGIAVGMALGLKRVVRDRWIYNLLSDGELDEGSTWEAVQSAPHWKLDNLIAIVDVNNMQADGPSTRCSTSSRLGRSGRRSAGTCSGCTATIWTPW